MTHVWAFRNCCVCLVIITRECFRNLNQTLQLEYTKLGLKEKLKGRRMSITHTKVSKPLSETKATGLKKRLHYGINGKSQPASSRQLSISGRSCLSICYMQGAQKELACHFSHLPFAFFPSISSLLNVLNKENWG